MNAQPQISRTTIPALTGQRVKAAHLVAQRAYTRLMLQPGISATSGVNATTSARQRGEGMELEEIRPFSDGDNPRDIDWRVTARSHRVHVRQYQPERETPVMVLLDLASRMWFGSRSQFKTVLAAQLMALIGWAARNSGRRIGGIVLGHRTDSVPPGRERALLRLFGLAERSTADAAPPLHQGLSELAHSLYRGARCYLISDFAQIDERCMQHLSKLSKTSMVRALQVADPLELRPPPHPLPILTPSGRHWSGGLAARRMAADNQRAIAEHFAKLNIPLSRYSTGDRLDISQLRAEQ